ncbi:MAG: tail fiber domain-containing protein, partial [Bacteroidia bacterium]|nr:tail fiber domain-containing protein [Bacteroidia bacterium]
LAGRDLTISGSNTITLPDSVNDADANPTNELQNLTLVGRTLTITDGNSVSLPDSVNDDDADPNNEIQSLSLAGRDLTISGSNTITLPDSVNDADANPTNELQNLTLVGRTLTITDGNSVSLPDSVNDDDADPNNEIQSLSLAGRDLTISGSNTITLPDSVNDADANPTNELQNLTLVGRTLTITDGNSVSLPDSVNDDDADPNNEIQSLSLAGRDLTISGSNTITLPDSVNDADANPTNELQTLSLAGNTLTITNGNSVSLRDSVIDDDANPTNEIQSLSLSGRDLTISGSNTITLPDSVNDADANPANELQNLSITGTTLSISSGNSITIPTTQYFGGTGIAISSDTIINLGDTNPNDDILTSTTAGGDLTGTFSALTVNGIKGSPIESGSPDSLDVLRFDGTEWRFVSDFDGDTTNEIQSLSLVGNQLTISGGNTITLPGGSAGFNAGTGIFIDGSNTIFNTGDVDDTDDIVDTTAAGGDIDGVFSSLNVNAIQGNPVEAGTPSLNDVLLWDGAQWALTQELDRDTTNEQQKIAITGTTLTISGSQGNSVALPYVGGTGIALSGATIINTGDADGSDDITTSTAALGDLSGVFPNPTVAGIQGFPVSNTTPSLSNILKWSGSQWVPSADSVDDADADATNELQSLSLTGRTLSISSTNSVVIPDSVEDDDADATNELQVLSLAGDQLTISSGNTVTLPTDVYTAGTGIAISSNTIINIGDTDSTNDLTITSVAQGDVTGLFSALTVERIQGNPVSVNTPTAQEVLKWNGAVWIPSTDSVNDDDADATNELQDLDLTGDVLSLSSSTATIDLSDFVRDSETAGGDLNGTFPNPTVDGLQGNPVSVNTPTAQEVLKWNGAIWIPSTDSVNDDDADVTNELQDLDLTGDVLSLSSSTATIDLSDFVRDSETAGGDLNGTFPNLTVDGLQGNPVSVNTPTAQEVLKWNGAIWIPSADSVNDADADASNELQDLDLTGDILSLSSSTATVDLTDFVRVTETAQGDLDGTVANPIVDGLRGNPISATGPTPQQILKWTGAEWTPSADSVNDADADASNELQDLDLTGDILSLSSSIATVDLTDFVRDTETATGDLGGTFGAPTVDGLQGTPVSATTPDNGEFLTYDGTSWTPDSLTTSLLVVNSGIVPNAASSYDLGSASAPFDSLFLTSAANIVSDARLKKNIEPLNYGIKELMSLNPVSYEMNHRAVGQRQLGLLAQDVEGVIDEVVSKHSGSISLPDGTVLEGGHYGITYTELIPVIIKGIQEQQKAIEKQEIVIEKQEEMIDLLKAQIELLKEENGRRK